MKRTAAILTYEIRLQFRNGFYYAAAFVVALAAIVLNQIPNLDTRLLLPGLLIGNLVINTFYFVAGLVLLEKDEGVLEVLIVTPLRSREYLASKAITLAAFSLVENLLIVLLVHGAAFNLLPLLLGLILASVLYVLVGFIAVLRYRSINEFLLPSMLYIFVLGLPLVDYFGLLQSSLFYLHPLQAPLRLLQAAFQPLSGWEWAYGVLYALAWILLLGYFAARAFHRFVIRQEGA